MSSCILGNVWDACAAHGIKGAKLMIMARLADYSNDDGVSYPGVETICRQLGLGESTVRTAITELESAGWLRREMRRKGNRNTSNRYYLNADRLENLARIEKDRVKRLRQLKNETRKFHPSDSEGSHFDPSDSERSGRFDPSDSGKKRVLTLQNLDPESQGLKPDPQVTSKQESQDTGTSADAIVPSSPGIPKYSPVFEEVWYAYPKRAGGNPKVSAWKAWSARLREGVKPEDILAESVTQITFVRQAVPERNSLSRQQRFSVPIAILTRTGRNPVLRTLWARKSRAFTSQFLSLTRRFPMALRGIYHEKSYVVRRRD